jgi:hypothetical protein
VNAGYKTFVIRDEKICMTCRLFNRITQCAFNDACRQLCAEQQGQQNEYA